MKITKLERHSTAFGQRAGFQVQEYVKSLRESGAVVNSRILIAGTEGIVKSYDINFL